MALAGWDGARQGAPQHPVLGEDVHQLAVEAEAGPLPGQWGANQDQPVQQGDPADAVDQPVHFHAPAGRQGSWRWACGGGPAGRPSARRNRAKSTSERREGTVLIHHPPTLRWQLATAAAYLTIGIAAFRILKHVARNRGSLARY